MYLVGLIAYVLLSFNTPATQVEIWYVWIDANATVNGQQTRIVSKKPFAITCCVKSGKYTRLNKAAEKWIRENYDPEYAGPAVFKNIQDEDLALTIISKASEEAEKGNSVLLVDYTATCK